MTSGSSRSPRRCRRAPGSTSSPSASPTRCFDVGIAEQHAVTFAAGLACEGMKPFAAIYSTFLQRAYDQVVHDVAIQKLPVRFAHGPRGARRRRRRDPCRLLRSRLSRLPARLRDHGGGGRGRAHAHGGDLRRDRRRAVGRALSARRGDRRRHCRSAARCLPIGRGRIVREGTTIAILSLGARLQECLKAADELAGYGLSTTVADARFAKPLDSDLIERLAREHEVLITIEEGSIGGFGSHVLHHLAACRAARSRAEGPADGPARPLHRPRYARRAIRAGRAQRPPHRADRAHGLGPRPGRALGPGLRSRSKRRSVSTRSWSSAALSRRAPRRKRSSSPARSGAARPSSTRPEPPSPRISRSNCAAAIIPGSRAAASSSRMRSIISHIDVTGAVALDIGASTGGFTDVLLTRGAARVYAVDVGHGQLAWKLRQDPRVVVLERVNARHLTAQDIPEPPDLVVCDASFIGLAGRAAGGARPGKAQRPAGRADQAAIRGGTGECRQGRRGARSGASPRRLRAHRAWLGRRRAGRSKASSKARSPAPRAMSSS